MRFSITAVLALATSLVQAQYDPTPGFHPITKPTQGEEVAAGSTYEIVWEPSASYPGTITIGLLGGDSPSTLDNLPPIASGVDGSLGSYSWAVPATLGDKATYGIKIILESDTKVFQYGFPFKIVGGGAKPSTSASGSATGSATASATVTDSATETATETSASASASASASGSASTSGSSSVTKTISSASSTITIPSSTLTSTSASGNWSTTAHSTITTLTTGTTASTTRSATSTIATNGVASLAAGSFAMLGGVAMAVFAL